MHHLPIYVGPQSSNSISMQVKPLLIVYINSCISVLLAPSQMRLSKQSHSLPEPQWKVRISHHPGCLQLPAVCEAELLIKEAQAAPSPVNSRGHKCGLSESRQPVVALVEEVRAALPYNLVISKPPQTLVWNDPTYSRTGGCGTHSTWPTAVLDGKFWLHYHFLFHD